MDYQVDFIDDNVITVKDSDGKYEINLEDKLLQLALKTIRLLSLVPYKREFDVFRNQLSKSATSIGANYQESQASSYPEFRQRIQICLRETRETLYWLKLLKELFKDQPDLEGQILILYDEAIEIKNIFGTIYNKVRKNFKI